MAKVLAREDTKSKFWLRHIIIPGMDDNMTIAEFYIGINTYEIFMPRVLVGVGIVASIKWKIGNPKVCLPLINMAFLLRH